MPEIFRHAVRCTLWVQLLVAAAAAQNVTGTISGVVRDPSQAVVVGAKVSVRNADTGLQRTVESNSTGEYSVPFLPVGPYTVRVQMEGFKTAVQTGIRIEILQVRPVDFQLELGAVAETVSVESRAPLLETETSQAGEVIKNEQVNRMPLNVRQFMQLTFLAPMATPATGDRRSVEVDRDTAVPSAAGQRPENNNYQIDGMDNKENGRNNFAISPPVDSISEFKVQTGVAPAEFGRGGAAIINVVTKSGTNSYHGTLYEFVRNNRFDARPFFSNRTNPLNRHQFGGALGGPVRKDKLFFFTNYEALRESATGNPVVGQVFTPGERAGVFTSAVRDPVTRQPFPNNTIPASRIDPVSANILKLVPLPNNPAEPARNFVFNDVPSGRETRTYAVGRADYNLGQSDIVYGRYLFNEETALSPPRLPPPANSGGTDFKLRAQGASAHWNHVFNPGLINSASLGYMRYNNQLATLNSFKQDYVTPAGITNTLAAIDPLFWAAPAVSIPGYLMPTETTPNYRTTNNYQIQESLVWNKGRHTFKIGGDLREIRQTMFYTGGNGSTSFGNRYTLNNVADFLMGVPAQVSKTARATTWTSTARFLGVFIQDDWKLSPRLTLNLGFRYEVESAVRQLGDDGLGFDVPSGDIIVSQYIKTLPAIESFYKNIRPDLGYRVTKHRAPYDADTNNIAPRIGFAFSVTPSLVIRAGAGIFYAAPEIQGLVSSNDFAPNTLRPIWTADPLTPSFGWNPEGTTSAEASLRNAPLTVFPFIMRHFPYGKTGQWNLGIQKQLGSSFVLETMYQGSNGVNLLVYDNINNRPPGPGNVQQNLRYPGYARVQNADVWARSWFQGASLKLEQRPWHGLSYLVAYTFSKTLDDASSWGGDGRAWTDPANRRNGKGPSAYDARNRFTAAYEYGLPFGRGKKFGSQLRGIGGKFVSGWGIRGITVFQTGLPQSPSMNLSRLGTCSVQCSARPDRLADGNLPKDVRTIDRFYDAAAFRLLALGGVERRIGNAGRHILNSAGMNNFDLQIFKDTQIREGHSIEFRWENFNAWNHTQFGAANVNLENTATFGRVTSTAPPRIMQFVLKYAF